MRRRFAWLTRRPSAWSVGVPLVALLAGVIFSASSQAARGTDLRSTASGMPDLIREHTRENARLSRQLSDLQSEVDRLNKAAAPGDARLSRLTNRADALADAAGTVEVRGPAVSVSLDDSDLSGDQLPPGVTVDDVVVHQQDVQAVVNALWRGGAEAMMLMDQRVISTSAVRCVGNTLILHGRVYSPPFTVSAIGNTRRLKAALDRDPQVEIYREYVDEVGLGYDVTTTQKATFPAYSGSTSLDHVEVVGPLLGRRQ